MILLLAVIVAARVFIGAAETAGINALLQDVSTVGDDPVSRPPRPRSRGPPPAPGDGNVPDDENPPGRGTSPIRSPAVPSAHDQALSTPPNPRRPATPPRKSHQPTSRSCRTDNDDTSTVVLQLHNRTTTTPTAISAVRNQPERQSGINRNSCPQSPEYAVRSATRRQGKSPRKISPRLDTPWHR